MTKDQLTIRFIELSQKNIEAFDGLKEAINNINETNVLHNAKTEEMANHVDRLVTSVNMIVKLFGKVVVLLILALIVLAGAEKVLKFM